MKFPTCHGTVWAVPGAELLKVASVYAAKKKIRIEENCSQNQGRSDSYLTKDSAHKEVTMSA